MIAPSGLEADTPLVAQQGERNMANAHSSDQGPSRSNAPTDCPDPNDLRNCPELPHSNPDADRCATCPALPPQDEYSLPGPQVEPEASFWAVGECPPVCTIRIEDLILLT